MKKIKLTQGKYALIDDEDWLVVSSKKWHANFNRKRFYAATTLKGKTIYMHQCILWCPNGMTVDHINGNGLDNRRSNLRIATNAQNARNQGLSKNNKSGYKGVILKKETGRWRARIRVDFKIIHLGYFSTSEEAAEAYNEAANKYHGIFAKLNKIPRKR